MGPQYLFAMKCIFFMMIASVSHSCKTYKGNFHALTQKGDGVLHILGDCPPRGSVVKLISSPDVRFTALHDCGLKSSRRLEVIDFVAQDHGTWFAEKCADARNLQTLTNQTASSSDSTKSKYRFRWRYLFYSESDFHSGETFFSKTLKLFYNWFWQAQAMLSP